MNKRQIEAEIQDRVEAFAAELSELIQAAALASVQDALADSDLGAPTRRRTKKRASKKRGKKARGAKKRSTKRSTKRRGRPAKKANPATMKRITDYLGKNPGQGVSEIASGLGTQSATLKRSIAQLLDEGKLRKTGQRRGTKYFVK